MTVPQFTVEQLYEQAQGNQTAFVLGTLAYFKEHNQSAEEWVTFLGTRFAPSWEDIKGQGAKAAMELTVQGFASAGGSLHSFSGDESKAEAAITDWPSSDFFALLGLTIEDIDPFYEIYQPIAASLNLSFTWHREGNQVTFRFTR